MPEDEKSEKAKKSSKGGGPSRRPKAAPKQTETSKAETPAGSTKAKASPHKDKRRSSGPRRPSASDRASDAEVPQDRRPTVTYVRDLKGKRPIVALTAYDAPFAKLVSDAGADLLLVGDSVGTTLLGFETTVPVTLDAMVHHAAAARRGNPDCLLVADLPFGEASLSFDRLLLASRRLMQEGAADAVKVEGGRDVADDVERLVNTGVPVLGHVGLQPQMVKTLGGYRKFANDREEAENLFADAVSLEEAGCFAIVAEMVREEVAAELTRVLQVPLIGIGSGAGCDGQIIVTPDVLGLTPGPTPSFVKPYADLSRQAADALANFVRDVRQKRYP